MAFPPKKKPKPGGGPPSPGQEDPLAAGPPVAVPPGPQVPPPPGSGVDPYAAMAGQISPNPVPPSPMPFPGVAGPPPTGGYPPATGMMGEPDGDDNAMLMALLAGGGGGGPPPMGGGGGGGGFPLPMGGVDPMMDMMGGGPPPMGGGGPGLGMDPNMLMDPYHVMPGEPDHVFDGVGTGDPQMGLADMIKLLMLAKAGVGGGAQSSSGLTPEPPSNVMSGMDFTGGGMGGFGGM